MRTDDKEQFLVQSLEFQSCDSAVAVWKVGTKRSSDLKSRYFLRSRVRSGISDFKVSSRKASIYNVLTVPKLCLFV